ncbi:unnamed protein product [Polarella glacialis]|uniref:Autophagy-related protein 2 n=1 Tax=Polarella glacialis TaxID=89957 RepID=A0A813GRD7_POLGL|nr:unnamed protein product [Polarella glacialis]
MESRWSRLGFTALPLKRFYKYLLKRLIGGFLRHDIDLEQLEVQLYKGIVQLKSLELDVAQFNLALLSQGLLLHFASGMVGCVKMDIPWRNLLSDHCKVFVSGLHVSLAKGLPADVSAEWPLGGGSAAGGGTDLLQARQTGPNSVSNSLEEKSRYSEEGVETLSRLVKLVLSRMEICLHDASVTVSAAPEARSALRARISSVVLFSDGAASETGQERTIRVRGISLSLVPEEAASPLIAASKNASQGGEELLASTEAEAAAPSSASSGVLMIRQTEGFGGFHLDVSLSLPSIRIALAPRSWRALSECLVSLSQVVRRAKADPAHGFQPLLDAVAPAEQPGEEQPPSRSTSFQAPPSMVRSLVESTLPGNQTPARFWHELYGLFEADAQLEDDASVGEGLGASESQAAEDEDEEAVDAITGSGREGESASTAAGGTGQLLGITLKVDVASAAVLLCLSMARSEGLAGSGERLPAPADVQLPPGPSRRLRGDQAQLCLQGLSLSLSKELSLGQPGSSGSVTAPVAITSAQSVAVHLHKFNAARCADDDDAGAESLSEEEAAEADEAYVAPSSELFHSMLMASASSAAPNAPSAFRTLAASDMFRSARSTCPLEAEDGARTPSAPSVHCSTHESLDAAELTDDSDAESFGESSVHSLSQGSDAPAEDVVPAEIQEEVSGRSAPLNAASAPSPSGGARGARKAPRAAVIQSVPEELEQLFFDRAQPIREVLLPGLSSGSEVGAEEDLCGLERSGRWRRRAPHFSSKQVLQLLSPEGPGGGGSSSSRDSGCAAGGGAMPPLPLPGSNHPIWASLRPPAGPAVQKVWAEWSAASPGPREDAFQRVGGQLRIGCQAALVSLCVESLQMLAAGTAALGRQSSSKGASSTESPQRQNQSGLPVAHSLPSIVAVSPLLRVVVQLSKGGCAICDTVLPRISTPQPQPGERNTDLRAAAGSLSHQELLRFDAASAGLRLLSEEPDHASTTIRLLSVGEPSGSDANTSGSEDLREPGFTLSCHVAVRRDAAVAGDDNDSSSQVQQPQPSEAVVAFAAAASADLAAPVLSDWTKISVPKAKVSPGRRPGTPSGTAEAEGADPLAQEQEQPGSSSRAGQAGTERGTLGGDGSSGVSRQAKVELELSVPASLRLFAHTGSLHRIKDEVAVFASRLAREVFAASPSAPSDIAESELAPIGVTVLLGDLTCDLIEQEETQTRDDSAEGQANRSGSESCTAHPKDAIQVSLANLNCRVVQLPGPSLSFCALGGDLRFELVSEVSLEGERGPSSTRCSNILLRPWFQPTIRSASTQSQRQSTRNEVPSAGYPWEVQHARARQQAVLRSFLAAEKGDRGEWQDSNSLLLLARQRRGAKANITLCSLVFSRLVVLAQHSLLERTIRRLIHMAKSTQAEPARTVDEERAAPKEKAIEPATGHVDLQISMLDCLVDFPSLAYALQWPITSPHGLNVPLPPPVLRGADADMWRAVLHAARITVSLNNAMGLAKGLRFRVADANLYLVDHPHNLGQLDLLSSAQEVREFLVRAGFAHILELSAASASWQPPERGEGSAAELTLKEELVDLDLGQVSGHLRADTVKCLQSVAAELAELLPQPQLQAASAAAPGTLPAQHAQRTQQQRMAPLATSLPSPRPLQTPAASAGRPAELPRRAPAQTAAEEDQGILQSIDMFAFSPPVRSTAPQMPHRDAVSDAMAAALGEDLLEDVGDGEGDLDLMPEPRPLQAFRSVSSTSCLIDDYIRTQELQQSPRQPVRACPASPFSSHDGFEMELLELPEAEDEAEEDRLSAAGEAAAEAEAEEEELSEAEELRRALQSEQVGDIFQDRSSRKPVVASGSSGGESSTSVAVCLFDPEAFDIEELRSEDWSARRELERMFEAAEDMPLAPLSPHQQLPAVNYQDGSAAVWYVDPAAVQVVQDCSSCLACSGKCCHCGTTAGTMARNTSRVEPNKCVLQDKSATKRSTSLHPADESPRCCA